MAVVKPFTSWRYNPTQFKNLSEVVAPPYDVISENALVAMRGKTPYHYTKIILPEGENKHSQAAEILKKWQKEEVLIQDLKPALYFYRQSFKLTSSELFCQKVSGDQSRTSIFCRVGLEDYNSKIILPHEKTFSGPKADRYKLMESTQGNMEPVFLGYDSPRFSGDEFKKIILAHKPLATFTDDTEVRHELWAITDEKVINEIEKVLAPKKFFILDGHHRYETALKFYHDHQKTDARLDHRFVLAAICSFRQPGTVILPTHRALKNGDIAHAQREIKELGWEWLEVKDRKELEKNLLETKATCFGFKTSNSYYFLRAPHDKPSKGQKKLDLEVLHEDLLPHFSLEPDLDYIKDIEELEAQVQCGFYKAGFLVRPSTVDEVMAVAEEGLVMPHKSTFFYPKIPSGFVINTFS